MLEIVGSSGLMLRQLLGRLDRSLVIIIILLVLINSCCVVSENRHMQEDLCSSVVNRFG